MLRAISTDLWAIEDVLRLPGGLRLPSRTTILRISGDRLVVHSPLAIDDATARAIEALGEVSVIVAPSCLHHLQAASTAARWPTAKVLGAPSLGKKLAGLPFDPLPSSSSLLGGELVVRRIDGVPRLDEHVFFHRASRTLVVTDLVFNVHECPGFGMPILLRLVGAWKKLAQSRIWRMSTKDRAAAASSLAEVLAWDFDRLVMAHGDVIESGAREPLAEALHWLRAGAPRLLSAASP